MKRIVLTYGIIGGIIVSAMMWLTLGSGKHDFDNGMWIGYTTMVIALSTIFFAVKGYRDKHLGGSITFGKAFLMGLYITLVVSTLYVASWMVLSATSKQDYMEQYYEHQGPARKQRSLCGASGNPAPGNAGLPGDVQEPCCEDRLQLYGDPACGALGQLALRDHAEAWCAGRGNPILIGSEPLVLVRLKAASRNTRCSPHRCTDRSSE
ncbi:MAG: DUF4199 domain-containing protein [Flavobacteriales bacterium]|nr:DUF4199 domain-containing protein [Flavobacteriales bacterium]